MMSELISPEPIEEFGEEERRLLQECIHCGLCLPTCPTYMSNGKEMDSPRGRLYLMESVINGVASMDTIFEKHIKSCLVCRACETACPAGVQFGHLMETTREIMTKARKPSKLQRFLLRTILPSHTWLSFIFTFTRLIQIIHLDKLLTIPPFSFLIPAKLRELHKSLPKVPYRRFGKSASQYYPSINSDNQGTVALFTGCIMDHLFPHVHLATVRILNWNGYNVSIPSNQTCCGALHSHAGDSKKANRLAMENNQMLLEEKYDYIIINSAGCGSHIKSYFKYAESKLSNRVIDLTELLAMINLSPPKSCPSGTVVYDEPCHLLHGQGISFEPKSLLEKIPGIKLLPLKNADQCCGSAGSYSLSETEMSLKILDQKMRDIKDSGATIVVTANPGCQIQLNWGVKRSNINVEVLHIAELLDLCYKTDSNYLKLTKS